VLFNVLGGDDPSEVTDPVMSTVRSVFPSVLCADAGSGNTIVLAWAGKVDLDAAKAMLASAPEAAGTIAAELSKLLRSPGETAFASEILTDERSDLDIREARVLNAIW